MTEEEKEIVINNLKKSIKYHKHMENSFCKPCIQSIEMAIKLIEEQQKEIEDWTAIKQKREESIYERTTGGQGGRKAHRRA